MKCRMRFILCSLLFSIVITCLVGIICILHKRNKKEHELLAIANNIITRNELESTEDSAIEQEIFSVNEITKDEDVIGKLIIPSINIEAPVKEGTSKQVLREAVGHFSNTNYWNGNVCLASHNRGTYAHYFQRINKLNVGDKITYATKLGSKTYVVTDISNISEYDVSVLENKDYNCITLITCISGNPDRRLCVRAVEK